MAYPRVKQYIPIPVDRACFSTAIGMLLLFLCWGKAPAQNARVDVSGYSVSRFTDENGLPQNSIKAIARDPYGFLWLATEDGVVRFDGKSFRTYGKGELELESGRMLGIFPGKREGELLAITDHAQAVSIYGGEARHTSDLPKAYYALYRDYARFPGNDLKLGHPMYNWLSPGRSFQTYMADARSYYVCSAEHIRYYRAGVRVFDLAYREKPGYTFFMLEGHLYLYAGGSDFYTPSRGGLLHLALDLPSAPADSSGEVGPYFYWGTASGIAYVYISGRLFELSRRSDGTPEAELLLTGFPLERRNIHTVYRDTVTDALFLGSSTEGLYIFRKHRFRTLKTGREGDYEVFYAHSYYGNNSVVTPQGYILSPDREPVHVRLSEYKKGTWRYSLLVTRGGQSLWVSDGSRLVELDREQRPLRSFALPADSRVGMLYEGRDGSIWVGESQKGMYRVRAGNPQAVLENVAPVPAPTYFWQTDDEYLWVGSYEGLYRFRIATGEYVSVPELEGSYVRSLYATGPGELWVTTDGEGFFLLRDNRVIRMPFDRNAYLRSSHCILGDANGYFWITTNKGLFQVAKNDLLAYADGNSANVYYYYYGKESGFGTNEFNGGCEPCGVRWENGAFSFPSLNGLVYFDPLAIRPEFPDKGIFFDRIELDGKPLAPADTIALSPDFSRITFYITTPYMGNAYNLRLEAALQKGYGEVLWTALDADNGISFTTLPPGTYRLVVRCPKGFGTGNYGYRTVVLLVPPAFWQTGWFIALVALLMVMGVYGVIRSRIRYVQRRNRELERLIGERTQDLRETIKALRQSKNTLARQSQLQQKMILAFSHDLKSPLMYLMITGQKMYESLRTTPGKLLDSIQIMYHSAFNMYHFTDNFLNYAKVYFLNERPARERFSLHALAQEKVDIFRYIAESKNIELRNHIPPDAELAINRMLLSVIFHNLLDNAIKYTDEGHIDFSVETDAAGTVISISDTGMGMDDDVKKQYADIFGIKLKEEYVNEGAGKGLGLQIVSELMHILGGRLHIRSEPGKGTTVSLHFLTDSKR